MSMAEFDSYYIPSWNEPSAAEAASFNNGEWSSVSVSDDIYTIPIPMMTNSPKIGAFSTSPMIAPSLTNTNAVTALPPFALHGTSCDPDSKEERGARTATGANAADAWASIVKDTNYGYNGAATATALSVAATAATDNIDIMEKPRAVVTGAPCTAPSGTVWLSVGDAMQRSKAVDMWQCVSDQWTRVPTVWNNTETSVLSINAAMSIMSAAALANAKRNFKKSYVPGSLPSSKADDIAAQRKVSTANVAIAGVTPMMEPVTAPILLAEAPKKSGRGGGRKRCTLFPKEIKPRGAPEPLLTPTGRIRKQSVKKSTYVKKDKSLRKNAKKVAAVDDKKPAGVVDKAARKNARRMRTSAKEVHHVTVAAAAAIAAIPVNIAAAATPVAEAAATAGIDIPDITAFDFEEEMDTRAGRGGNGMPSMAAVDAVYAIGENIAHRADTKLVTKVVYEEYLVDEFGNEVKLSNDGTLNGVPVIVRDEADVVR